jgi:hypothetical protein
MILDASAIRKPFQPGIIENKRKPFVSFKRFALNGECFGN